MQNHNHSDEDKRLEEKKKGIGFQLVTASHGSVWLKKAFHIFIQSKGVWFGIGTFIFVASLLPILSTFIILLMPLLVGGLMIGCSQISENKPMKFDYLFSGLKQNTRSLIILSLINSLSLFLVTLMTLNISSFLGFDLSLLVPNEIESGQSQALVAWLQTIDPIIFIQTFLVGMSVFLLLMTPVFMAFWFSPALICLKNKLPVESLLTSFNAAKKNKMPFLIYGIVAIGYLFLFFFFLTLIAAFAQPLMIPLMLAGYIAGFSISLISIYTSYQDIFPEEPTENEEIKSSSSQDKNDNGSMIA